MMTIINPGEMCGHFPFYQNITLKGLASSTNRSVDSGFRSSSSCGRDDEHYKQPRSTLTIPPAVVRSRDDHHDHDLQIVRRDVSKLKESGCYYPNMSQDEAKTILKRLPEGSFLIRNSSSPSYLFSMSVKTCKGPTSIRISFTDGFFKLDSTAVHDLPKFESIMDLLQYYMGLSKGKTASIILETAGKKTEVKLTKPYIMKVPSLKDICRRNICSTVVSAKHLQSLPLSDSCKLYLTENPYKL